MSQTPNPHKTVLDDPNDIAPFNPGWIEVITGSMFSGKTEELMRRLRRARFAKKSVKIFKPLIDNRYASDAVVSHDTNQLPCVQIVNPEPLYNEVGKVDVIGIDEAQFFGDEIVPVCQYLAENGIRVIVAGLDMDFLGRPFGPMPHLMSIAEYVTKVHAVCAHCGSLAHFSHRISNNDQLFVLGEKDVYEPLCRSCFLKATQQENQAQKIAQ